MSHLEMTKHIRGRVAAAGIKARVLKTTCCGVRYIKVVVPAADATWTPAEIETIGIIGQVNRLTFARKSPIDLENLRQLTGKTLFDFEYHGEAA